jgi:hypothetical protein
VSGVVVSGFSEVFLVVVEGFCAPVLAVVGDFCATVLAAVGGFCATVLAAVGGLSPNDDAAGFEGVGGTAFGVAWDLETGLADGLGELSGVSLLQATFPKVKMLAKRNKVPVFEEGFHMLD